MPRSPNPIEPSTEPGNRQDDGLAPHPNPSPSRLLAFSLLSRSRRPAAPPPRRLFYGWTMLLALAWGQVTSWGVLYYSFSVFVDPIGRDLHWSRSQLTGAFSLALLCSGVAGLAVGRWVDRHGPRLLMTAGSCAAALLLLALSQVDTLIGFYLIWAGLGVTMAATLYEPAFAAVATWFRQRRDRALTLLTFVGGFASVIYLPVAAWLVREHGWRTALTVLAVLLAALTIPPHAVLLRRRPEDLGLLPDGTPIATRLPVGGTSDEASATVSTAIRSVTFRWLTTGFCLAFFANVAVTIHLIPYLTDRGYTSGFAASAAGLIGHLALPGRLLITPLGSIVPRRFVAAAIFALQALALTVLLSVPTRAGVIAFVVLFGLGFGAITPARAVLVAELYGRANYGSISGVLALFVTAARALAPISAGLLYTAFGRYNPVFWLLGGIAVLAAGSVLLIGDDGADEPAVLLAGIEDLGPVGTSRSYTKLLDQSADDIGEVDQSRRQMHLRKGDRGTDRLNRDRSDAAR